MLSILRRNGRTSYLKIGKKLKVSEGTVRKRVKKMLEKGIIEKFTIETRTEFDFRTLMCLRLKTTAPRNDVVRKLKTMPYEVNHIYQVVGEYDIICQGETHSNKDMNKLIEKIRGLPEIVEMKSYTVLVMN